MLKIVVNNEKSTQEQAQMQDVMRFAALEINFVDQGSQCHLVYASWCDSFQKQHTSGTCQSS